MMKKKMMAAAMILTLTLGTATAAYAGEWKQDSAGWWYQNDDGSYLSGEWQWINGKCYYFDANGYMLANTVAPGGFQVGADGAWTVDGKVQIEVASQAKKNTAIPDGAFAYNGHHYYFYADVYYTWEEAKAYCESLGGYLAIINDSHENIALYDAMQAAGYENAYFGISDSEQEGVWKCVDGTTPEYLNWSSGEPNNQSGREHYAMFYYRSPKYQWNDGDFGHGSANSGVTFICEWDE